jgi:hypothetical protein
MGGAAMNRRNILRWLCALPFVPAALAKPRLTRLMTEPSVLETQPKLSAWDEDCYALDGYPDPAIRLAEEVAPGGMTTEYQGEWIVDGAFERRQINNETRLWRPRRV